MILATAKGMQAIEAQAMAETAATIDTLMSAAGRAVADLVTSLLPVSGRNCLIFAGPGHNGGDGLVAAQELAKHGAKIAILLFAHELATATQAQLERCRQLGLPITVIADENQLNAALSHQSDGQSVFIDALFGTGLKRPLGGLLATAVDGFNRQIGLKIAVDIPSGLDADRGVPLGACIIADHTVSFGVAKRGLVLAPGFTFVGVLHVAPIGLAPFAAAHGQARLLEENILHDVFASHGPLGHKGSHGHVLLLAGSTGKSGAALLAGTAALRAGAGLVTLALPQAVRRAVDGRVAELMVLSYPLPKSAKKIERAAAILEQSLHGKRVLAIGPGLSSDGKIRDLLRLVVPLLKPPISVVLDADALNHLATDATWLADRDRQIPLVLTPHPGEAARLARISVAEVQADRVTCALRLAQQFGAVVVLKGARSIITDGVQLLISPTGNAGLGSAGTGDALTGCIAAFLALGLPPLTAAAAAVYLHGAAADLLAEDLGSIGLLASDVIAAFPKTMERIRRRLLPAKPIVAGHTSS